MPDLPVLYDEESPAGRLAFPERGRVSGTPEGLEHDPMQGDYADIGGGFYLPGEEKEKAGKQVATASARNYFGDQFQEIAPIKFADEEVNREGLTFAPVVGEESNIHLMNQAQYNTMAGPKGPLARPGDHPTTANLVANLASSPGYALGSSELEMLSLVGGL